MHEWGSTCSRSKSSRTGRTDQQHLPGLTGPVGLQAVLRPRLLSKASVPEPSGHPLPTWFGDITVLGLLSAQRRPPGAPDAGSVPPQAFALRLTLQRAASAMRSRVRTNLSPFS